MAKTSRSRVAAQLTRREFLRLSSFSAGAAFLAACGAQAPTAGTGQTSGGAQAVSDPASISGEFVYWQTTTDTPLEQGHLDEFFSAFRGAYPNVTLREELIGYGDLLDKTRVAIRGGGGPNVATLPIMWGVEFAAGRALRPLTPEELGYSPSQFWPKAMNSVRWQGETYGVPTNNETMAFIYNKNLFEQAGLDPDTPPATWAEVVEFSNQIHTNLGISGLGMVARLNHGNTPFRFMPVLWAYGGSVLDELEDAPGFTEVRLNSDETRAALQAYYDMYVRDQSVPRAALDNTQTENRELFINEQVAMMISHPVELNIIREKNPDLVEQVEYVLYPEGPARRAAVFGGSNIHIFANTPEEQVPAALEFIKLRTNPEWANRLAWFSNPGNREGFDNEWFETRKTEVKYLDVATEMLEYGVSFPIVPESTEILNLVIPTMVHNALTEQMTIDQAVTEAEKQVTEIMGRRR